MTTKIKICGVTNIEDAKMIAELGADAIGFVFASSKRKIEPEIAKQIINKLPPFVVTVGVFMDALIDEVAQVTEYTGIDVIQLHGNEHAEYCNRLKRKLIKRISVSENDTTETLVSKMEKYQVSAYLLDPGAGSGNVFDWEKAGSIDLPLIIAGGLTPNNVKHVVNLLKPYGVDVSSGVEQYPGKKDRDKVKRFIEEVRFC